MRIPMRATVLFVAVAVATSVLAGCGGSSLPSSAAVESQVPATAGPQTQAPTEAPATETPVPATEAPATPSPTPGPPPKPADVTWTLVNEAVISDTTIRETYHVTWTEPDGVATQFVIYGVKGCLRESAANDGKPCVTKGMRIPRTSLVRLAIVPGTLREVDVLWDREGGAGPGPYGAVLIRAVNDTGKSIFTIAWSAKVCWGCTY